MTYEQLATRISELTQEQKEMNVTVLVGDEFMPVNSFAITNETDILDSGHPYLFFY